MHRKLRVLSEGATSNSCCKVGASDGDIFSSIGNMLWACCSIYVLSWFCDIKSTGFIYLSNEIIEKKELVDELTTINKDLENKDIPIGTKNKTNWFKKMLQLVLSNPSKLS